MAHLSPQEFDYGKLTPQQLYTVTTRPKDQKGDHACGLQEVEDLVPMPPEISIYSDSGWDSSDPNVLFEECNYNEGQSSNILHGARASNLNIYTAPTALHIDYAPERPELMRITVTLYIIVPRHLSLHRIILLIFPKSEPGQLQTIYATAWKIKKYIIC